MIAKAGKAHKLADGKRIVVKVGSALMADESKGAVRAAWLANLADEIAKLKAGGRDVVMVSSGAIAVGRLHLGLKPGKLPLEEKQAAAATGQIRLAHAYQEALARHDITVAQVLLTLDDTEERRRYLNARNTIDTLLKLGAVPVINENDTVATNEIRFGDNDRLAARVAAMISADTLVLLSTIDGLYSADPNVDPKATFIPEVREITREIAGMAGNALPGYSSGGMVTKLVAGEIAMSAGCRMVIADGRKTDPLSAIDTGGLATWFLPSDSPRSARKHWIASSLKAMGSLTLDDGAIGALRSGKSLLPAGVVAVDGQFERGDALRILAKDGREVARGLVAYGAPDAKRIMGHKSREIEALLGYRGRDVMVHRDDLALLEEAARDAAVSP